MKKIAIFANGCFWCTEAVFSMLKGVNSVNSGYVGGTLPVGSDPIKGPTYEQVSNGNTGFAEAIKIEYDPAVISYEDLLSVFFNTHDPTTLNRQGNDIGTQYRSAIFCIDDEQKKMAEKTVRELNDSRAYDKPVVIVVVKLEKLSDFYEAEDYHHNYYENHSGQPYCQLIIAPKLEKMQKRFQDLLK